MPALGRPAKERAVARSASISGSDGCRRRAFSSSAAALSAFPVVFTQKAYSEKSRFERRRLANPLSRRAMECLASLRIWPRCSPAIPAELEDNRSHFAHANPAWASAKFGSMRIASWNLLWADAFSSRSNRRRGRQQSKTLQVSVIGCGVRRALPLNGMYFRRRQFELQGADYFAGDPILKRKYVDQFAVVSDPPTAEPQWRHLRDRR